ncbi:TauD/TfdA family dioxygenase [Rhizobium laguerreae]|uniref:TauD/TfdA family dioxygenase n=1 Tax=Rhizobium laguerreae TaxID=1076926 RepID=UPI001C8FFD31|nr:TauD/TfdA family dioxygenase [Rhizobium laguerreae]MBY3348433.1 TauD/TfdA family dioxygenase [Rhizobium laguerreae]MBY3355977.1 TauD/TfdA family dioxygenase [Rhizobium laguerreae]MBY3369198.1 TauD/TfdA family dioxygenase [Rhizobium laguerreae]MBY3376587.1 TauD/TfdA family dioxygenase [Rhizobium laguerreae]MBY3390820.1 TauD/TfdA family dioxygenase [Rhizobium laguerreae]
MSKPAHHLVMPQSQPGPKLDRLLPADVAWDAATVSAAQFSRRASDGFLREVMESRKLLAQPIPLEGMSVDNRAFPALRQEAAMLRMTCLDRPPGFVILTGLGDVLDTETEIEHIFWRLCHELGGPFVQKSGFIRFGRVENLDLPQHQRPRYHETGTGGSIHTDSPIMPVVADFVGLLCVRTALTGGDSKFVSVARVHNIMLEHARDLLNVLYEPFYFDRRLKPEDLAAGQAATLYEPIFSYDPAMGDHGLRLRWQPEYVWQAPELEGLPSLSEKQCAALNILEGILEDRTGHLTVKASMNAGDLQLLNNHVVAHGRSAFEDHRLAGDAGQIDPLRRRLMRRVWLHQRA